MAKKRKFGVIVGRMAPIHLGHRRIIQKMLVSCGAQNSLLLLGSCNAPQSMRHFFTYTQRVGFIRQVFPNLRIVGMPDYPTDEEWLAHLDDQLKVAGFNPAEVIFYSGNEEDIQCIVETDRNHEIADRFDKTLPILSAQQVRSALVHDYPREEIAKMVGEDLVDTIIKTFRNNWQIFESK